MTLLGWYRSAAAVAVLIGACGGYAVAPSPAFSSPLASPVPAALPTPAAFTAVKGTKTEPAVEDCGLGKPEVRPSWLTLSCADANSLGVHLSWSRWGPTAAYATGTYTWNTCVPYCAASKTWDKASADFTLSKPVHVGTKAGWLFEQLVVRITGKVPSYMQREQTISEAPRPT